MNCEKNREMIQLYADGELEKEKESYFLLIWPAVRNAVCFLNR